MRAFKVIIFLCGRWLAAPALAGVPSGMLRRTSLTAERDVTITVVLSCIFVIIRHSHGGGSRLERYGKFHSTVRICLIKLLTRPTTNCCQDLRKCLISKCRTKETTVKSPFIYDNSSDNSITSTDKIQVLSVYTLSALY